MDDALRDMWRSVATFAPKLAAFLVILIIGWIVARLIAKAIDKILERVGFDRAVERGGVQKALARSNYDASTIVSKIVYYALLLFVLQLAFGVFGQNPISDLLSGVIAFLPKLVVALIIVVVASAIAAAVRDLVSNTLGGLSYGRLLANIASVFILGLGIIAALNQVGIALTVTLPVLVAILGTIGGILVVGVGGGLIRPMQQRWEDYLSKAEDASRNIRRHLQEQQPAASSTSRHASQAPQYGRDQYSTPETQQLPAAGPQYQGGQYGGGQPYGAGQPDYGGQPGYGQPGQYGANPGYGGQTDPGRGQDDRYGQPGPDRR
jgi:ABC-type multidrug transport system fused ATPase/permease subunit